MAEIEIGLDFAEAEKISEIKPLPGDDYSLRVSEIKPKEAGPDSANPGRPMLVWTLEVYNSPDPQYNGRKLFYNTMLPYQTPTGLETGGIGFLVDLTKALGKPWSKGSLRTEEYIGLSCKAKVNATEYKGKPRNEIKKFFLG